MTDGLQTNKGNGRATPAALRARAYRERLRAERAQAASVTRAVPNMTHAPVRHDVPIGLTLIGTAVLLAGIGMTMTAAYSITSGTGADRLLLAGLAVIADTLALILPAAAMALWCARRWLLSLMALVLGLVAVGITAMNIAGFLGANGDEFIAGRETASTERSLVLEHIGRLRAERATITESRPTGAIMVAIRNATKATVDNERVALALAKRRDQIDAELAGISGTIATLPAVDAIDPSASAISSIISMITGVAIADQTFARARTMLLLALPLSAGIILAVGIGLTRSRERT